jgi:hypothetical protein
MNAPVRPEAWMRLAVCQDFPELPWLSDADQVTEPERLGMAGVCRACGVRERCTTFVAREQISGGFRAGEFRDLPDAPDAPAPMARETTPETALTVHEPALQLVAKA